MAPIAERCPFCRRDAWTQPWAEHPGWLDVDCPVCGRYRVERLFWVAAHFKLARRPAAYRALARWLAEGGARAEPPEIPFEGWESVARPSPGRPGPPEPEPGRKEERP
jgi:hypothetical protein